MDDREQNQHKFLKFQIMNPYPIHSMTQESPTHSLWLMAYPSMDIYKISYMSLEPPSG